MRFPRIVSFVLWGATAFAAVGWALQWPSAGTASAPPVTASAAVAPASTAVQQLFALQTAPTATPAPAGAAHGAVQLEGIVFSTQKQHSRAIVQLAPGQVKSLAVGSELPDGRRIHAIDRRSIALSQDGHIQTLTLPAQP